MAWLESQNYAIVRTELDEVFYQEFEYDSTDPGIATARTEKLFPIQTIDRQAWIMETYKGPGLFPSVGEVQTVPSFTPVVGNKLTVPVLDFAQGVELSKNLFDDNLHGVWSKTVKELAMVARVTQDSNAFKIFRGAFTTTLTADGAAWISASHTLLNGQTYSNLVSGALSTSTLNDAIVKLRQQPNQAGVVLGSAPAYLVVPSPLFKHAREITDSALIADSGNNNVNIYRSAYGFEVLSSPYMDSISGYVDGSNTAWFLLARNHGVRRLVRQGLETYLRDWGMSNNRTYWYQANFREEVYVDDYVGSCGATGV